MTDAAASTIACPKCRRPAGAGEVACPRCGLLRVRFERFAAERATTEAAAPLDEGWARARAAWSTPAAHDRLLDEASRLGALPALARRYREALDAGPDPIAERRLRQLGVLMETAVRAQARAGGSRGAVRLLWALGYTVAALVLALSAWVFFITLNHR